MRWVTLTTMILLLGVSYGLYQLKYRVEGLQDRASTLNAQINNDRSAMKVLAAEWAYRTRPQRLQQLNGEFLHFGPVSVTQIASFDDLRLKPSIDLEPAAPLVDSIEMNPVTGEIEAPLPISNASYVIGGGGQ